MRITVEELAAMWRGTAYSLRGGDQPPVSEHVPDPESLAKADQLEACATDLENTRFHHELVQDADNGNHWWKKLR